MNFLTFQNILHTLQPAIPSSKIEGGSGGIVVDTKTKTMLAMNVSSAFVYDIEDETMFGESMFIPKEIVQQILKIKAVNNWEGIEKVDSTYKFRLGRVQIKFPEAQLPAASSPMAENLRKVRESGSDFSTETIDAISFMAEYMCQDDRKRNMYGLYAAAGVLYACDNIRIVALNTNLPAEFSDVFLPHSCVERIKGNKNINKVYNSENALTFFSDHYAFRFQKYAVGFPPVAKSINKVRAEDFAAVLVDIESAKTDVENMCTLVSNDVSAQMRIVVKNKELLLDVDAAIGSMNLRLPIETKDEIAPFRVNSKLFLEGLLLSNVVLIGKTWVMFFSEDIKYLLMKMS